MSDKIKAAETALTNIIEAVKSKSWKIDSPVVVGGGDPEIGYETWPQHEEWLSYAEQALASLKETPCVWPMDDGVYIDGVFHKLPLEKHFRYGTYKLEASLRPDKAVDIEKLYRKVDLDAPIDAHAIEVRGWNDAIDYITTRYELKEPETIAVFEFMGEKINVTRENSAFVRVVKDFIESMLNPKSESE